jgi:hypothetical protein
VLCCAVLCCAVLCCAVLCCAVLYCAVLYWLAGWQGLVTAEEMAVLDHKLLHKTQKNFQIVYG